MSRVWYEGYWGYVSNKFLKRKHYVRNRRTYLKKSLLPYAK